MRFRAPSERSRRSTLRSWGNFTFTGTKRPHVAGFGDFTWRPPTTAPWVARSLATARRPAHLQCPHAPATTATASATPAPGLGAPPRAPPPRPNPQRAAHVHPYQPEPPFLCVTIPVTTDRSPTNKVRPSQTISAGQIGSAFSALRCASKCVIRKPSNDRSCLLPLPCTPITPPDIALTARSVKSASNSLTMTQQFGTKLELRY